MGSRLQDLLELDVRIVLCLVSVLTDVSVCLLCRGFNSSNGGLFGDRDRLGARCCRLSFWRLLRSARFAGLYCTSISRDDFPIVCIFVCL